MRLKRGLAGIVLAGLALGLGGCPEPGNTITFWVMPNTAPDRHTAWLERKKAEFLKSDGIVVNYEIVSWGDSWLKIERALAGGNGPDVVQLRSTWNGYFAARQGLHKINLADFGGQDSFVPALAASTILPDGCFGVPWFGEAAALVCNDKIFRELGVAPPQSMAELFATGKKINSKRGAGAALALPGANADEMFNIWSDFFYTQGGSFLSADGKTPGFGGEAGVKAVASYLNLYREGLVAKTGIEAGSGESERLFKTGRAAMCLATPSVLKRLQEEMKGAALTVVPPPLGAPAADSYVLGANLVIPEKSPNKSKAARWINFLLKNENLIGYTRDLCVALPAKRTALANAGFKDGAWPVYVNLLAGARPYPPLSSWMTIERETSNAVKLVLISYLYGQYRADTISVALTNAAAEVDKALAMETSVQRK
jgi:ABC-type glycerol-3-phosphate transport system substrate-binding protein